MFKFFKNLFKFQTKKISFSNSCESKQEAKKREHLKYNLAQNDFYFWNKLNEIDKKEINRRNLFLH